MRRFLIPALFAGAILLPQLAADDAEANRLVRTALEDVQSGDYRSAAKTYEDAALLADTPQLKFNALRDAADAYAKAGLLEREFEVLEQMLTRYPAKCDFVKVTDRELAIAQAYAAGHRDPAFWALRWVPWLKGPNRTTEFFEKALKRAPFAKNAPAARLRLAFQLDEELKPDQAIEQLRALIKDYPTAPERKFAYLALGEMLFERSLRGDGDGRYNREAVAVFREFKNLYPKAPENEFVDRCLLKAKDVQAERLLNIARYYKRTGREGAAERYLNTVLKEYPDSKSAGDTEKLLVKTDPTYTPDGYLPEVRPREEIPIMQRLPEEASNLLIIPENSKGKYLRPIYDIRNKTAEELKEEKK